MKMQQTKSYWRLVAVMGVVSAFIASACVVTTSTDIDDDGGSGGSGDNAGTGGTAKGGSATGGSNTAGSATAGSGTAGGSLGGNGGVTVQCDAGEAGAVGTMPNSCEPINPNNDCQVCIKNKCCDQWNACYATEPGNQCGWGGPAMVDGMVNRGGELYCIQACLLKVATETQTAPDDNDVQACGANCATTPSNGATQDCGPIIGFQTNEIVYCMRENCTPECIMRNP